MKFSISRSLCWTVVALAVGVSPCLGAAVTLANVPAYNWYHGCGPTAAGSIMGYWDLRGYENLFSVSGWDNVKLTANVQQHISSDAHNAKYDPTPDAAGPIPPFTSIACWFQTSMDPLQFGWSYLSRADNAFFGYAGYCGYTFTAWNAAYGTQFAWSDLAAEIDAGRPMMFLVDSNGDGDTDHFVPVFGYDDDYQSSGLPYYACYDTWSESETVRWEQFQQMGYDWGVGYATYVHPEPLSDIPEPATLALVAFGSLAIALRRRA